MARDMDRIFIRDLCLSCTIGVNDWERDVQQTVRVDLDLETDTREAARMDDLRLTVDYKRIRNRVADVVAGSSCLLVEALAEKIAEACLEEPRVASVRVRLEKPGALRTTRTVGVEVHRSRT